MSVSMHPNTWAQRVKFHTMVVRGRLMSDIDSDVRCVLLFLDALAACWLFIWLFFALWFAVGVVSYCHIVYSASQVLFSFFFLVSV